MDNQIIKFNLAKKVNLKIRESLENFLNEPLDYKSKFLQSKYKTAFDGYSYMGQENSLNQYATDMLHSFVLSEFQEIDSFPKEFRNFLKEDWNELIETIREIEVQIIQKLNIPALSRLYETGVMGYMMSCNYFPKPSQCKSKALDNTRLSAHTDASLFTTLPYGISSGFAYYDHNENLVEAGQKEKMVLFSGYFLDFFTNGKIKAVNHQVNLPEDEDTERYSFAVFSIPKPNHSFWHNAKKIKSSDYYSAYLSLF